MRRPKLAVNRRGNDFATDDNHHAQPISDANCESGPGMQIDLGVESERAGGRMGGSHFRERPHHRKSDARCRAKTQNHSRTSELDSDGAAKEKAGTDGASKANHGE